MRLTKFRGDMVRVRYYPPGWKPGSTAGRDARRYIRFAPPMCITEADADFIVEVFDAAFGKLG